ncbi:MAG: hypothetical protein NTX75_14035 [Proteobacteria bacterium]|nr:hypothetical protein [Pseudomonadota bacterium]
MITNNTVFILGAGASSSYGYPTGAELRRRICSEYATKLNNLLTGNIIIDDNNPFTEVHESIKLATAFRESDIKSIDRFLAINPEFSDIGKMAIAMLILDAEKTDIFRDNLEDNWYFYLYNKMIDTFTTGEAYKWFGVNKITFITFNYDRSLEYYLFSRLKSLYYKISDSEIIEQINKIPIYHVYGQVDDLPWQGGNKQYGSTYKYNDIHSIKDRIKVIFERTDTEIEYIRAAIGQAELIYFLGFGYDKINMKAIGLPESINAGSKVFGTAFEITEKEKRDIITYLTSTGIIQRPDVKLRDCNCVELLKEYL